MDLYPLLPETRVMPWVKLTRERMLSVRGEASVSVGTNTNPLDVVARATPPKEIRAVPLTRLMGLREQDVPKHLLKHAGDLVEAREIIISKTLNIFNERLIYPSPGAGRILAVQGSWLLLELDGLPTELRSLYRGMVTRVVPQFGVTLDVEGAWAQGIWGAGDEASGPLKIVAQSPGEVLTPEKIDVSARGAIVVAGVIDTMAALTGVARARAAGLVVGSITVNLKSVAENLGLCVIVTEGFGRVPMCAPIYGLLKQYDGNEACVAAGLTPRVGGVTLRPEVFIPRTRATNQTPAIAPSPLVNQLGASVRVTREPYLGQVGKLAQVSPRASIMANGARAYGAEVELASGRAFVPWSNLELIG